MGIMIFVVPSLEKETTDEVADDSSDPSLKYSTASQRSLSQEMSETSFSSSLYFMKYWMVDQHIHELDDNMILTLLFSSAKESAVETNVIRLQER
jgi:hypothetical protein